MPVQPNKIAYITGSSAGIGKALTENLLASGYSVYGLSRNNTIEHPLFTFIPLDLSSLEEPAKFNFKDHPNADILLINNAGIIGEIGPVGELAEQNISEVIQVNVISPEILINKFIKQYANQSGKCHIINISSGAGKHPIESWAPYCSSKAAIDLFSQTIQTEFKLKNRSNWHIHSIAPGVVDTNMQINIRNTPESKFSIVQKFKDYKDKGELYTPEYVADKISLVIKSPEKYNEVLLSVRDL